MHVAMEWKNSLLTGRHLQQNQAQCERPSATTDWGIERTANSGYFLVSLWVWCSTRFGTILVRPIEENVSVQEPYSLVQTFRQYRRLLSVVEQLLQCFFQHLGSLPDQFPS
ncbi:hypothetical protein GOODEAATRI_021472 [Goodea atripinnis]|uniref:Uncharacterized protein n=1 Tax=Goodea atripinnis TaxID=208336 RepID=A0ABV0N3J4_9TELE